MAAASFEDELELFSGKQDLNTIVRSDYKGHEKVGVERHKPKDQIEVYDLLERMGDIYQRSQNSFLWRLLISHPSFQLKRNV